MLPSKSAIIDDRYPVNMMLNYKLLGEGAAAAGISGSCSPCLRRSRRSSGSDIRSSRSTRAAPASRSSATRSSRSTCSMRAARLSGLHRQGLDRGDRVDAGCRGATARQQPWLGAAWRVERHHFRAEDGRADRDHRCRARTRRGAKAVGLPEATVTVSPRASIGEHGSDSAIAITVTAGRRQAVISVEGRQRGQDDRGAALVLVDPRGGVEAHVLDGSRDLRVPFERRTLPLFRVSSAAARVYVGNAGWQDITASPPG